MNAQFVPLSWLGLSSSMRDIGQVVYRQPCPEMDDDDRRVEVCAGAQLLAIWEQDGRRRGPRGGMWIEMPIREGYPVGVSNAG
jgi:hypothetical protein